MQVMTEATFEMSLRQVQRITSEFARRVDELVFSFGHVPDESPERKLLELKVREILGEWSDRVWDCGALPQELWTVIFHTTNGPVRWQYPHSQFIERRP